MKKKMIAVVLLVFAFSLPSVLAQPTPNFTLKDFKKLVGRWKGSLTYLDYSSGKPYTMPADIDISQMGKTSSFIFSHSYPNEPNANSSDTVIISLSGKSLNNEAVKARRLISKNEIEMITEFSGVDGNDEKPATIRTTYTIGKRLFKTVKEVQFNGGDKWLKRHEYHYTRR